MKALIAEDDFISRSILLRILAKMGDCDVATDGEEAINAINSALDKNAPYQLICLDINMPKITGDRVLQLLRQAEEQHGLMGLSGARVVMTTGLSEKENILGAFRNGCEAYLIKPIEMSSLLEQLLKLGLLK